MEDGRHSLGVPREGLLSSNSAGWCSFLLYQAMQRQEPGELYEEYAANIYILPGPALQRHDEFGVE
jgi:hypothetical protein